MIEVKTDDCSLSTFENAWVIVEKRSYIKFDIDRIEPLKLSIYPYKMVEQYDSSGLNIVIPELNSNYMTLGLNALYAIGFITKSRRLFYPEFFTEDQFSGKKLNKNDTVIAIAKWTDGNFPLQLRKWLPAYFDENLIVKSDYKSFYHPDQFYSEVLVVESFFRKSNLFVFITGLGKDYFKLATFFVSLIYPPLDANVAFFKNDAIFYTYNVESAEKKQKISPTTAKTKSQAKQSRVNNKSETGSLIPDNSVIYKYLVIILSVIVLLLLFYEISRRRSSEKGNREENKNKK
jgi:hypothetical protein